MRQIVELGPLLVQTIAESLLKYRSEKSKLLAGSRKNVSKKGGVGQDEDGRAKQKE